MRQNLRRTNSDADEDEENYRHRSINGRPPLGQHDGDGADDSEQSNIMMMTEDSGGQLPSHAVGNEKADHSASNQEITLALEEDAMMEKHEGSIQKILELLCLMGAGYWRLCQVGISQNMYNRFSLDGLSLNPTSSLTMIFFA